MSNEKTLVDLAIQKANGDTIGTEEDAYLRQCCGNVWTMIRDRLEAGGHTLAAALVQDWCEPDWVREATGKPPRTEKCEACKRGEHGRCSRDCSCWNAR